VVAFDTNFSVREELPPARQKPVRILIADESKLNCQLLEGALTRSQFGFEIVASTTTRKETLDCMSALVVDLALVNETLNDSLFDGFHVLRDIQASFPATRAIALVKCASPDRVVDVFRAGAKGIFCRAEPIDALIKCIEAVRKGQIWLNTQQLHFVVDALAKAAPLRIADVKGRHLLAKRETEVANLIAEGYNNRETAQRMGLSEHTVSNYLFRIYEKLGISTRVELVHYVLRSAQNQIDGKSSVQAD
jgi:DNA-binding NarL/FixJ family response regulator